MSPRRIGKYELRERLGRGGMAEVWKAYDTQLQRYVAIKLLHPDLQNDPDFLKRFIREGQAVASLHHPNIVKVHDFQVSATESDSAVAYMVMDYIEGPTLTEYIRATSRAGNYPPDAEIIHLFASLSSAIDYAHSQGMIHRDIKPANIMLDQRTPSRYRIGLPVLSDFGIVKLMGSSTGTLTGTWLGTPLYISPEQAQSYPGNERSDIYSLGVILYEVCTGVQPFQGDRPIAIIMQHISAMPTPPQLINPQISGALSDVILRCLAKAPEARFPSASAMTAALTEAFALSSSRHLNQFNAITDGMDEPTFISSPESDVPVIGSIAPPSGPHATPRFTVLTPAEGMPSQTGYTSPVVDPYAPLTPVNNASSNSLFIQGGQNFSHVLSTQSPPALTPAPPTAPGRKRRAVFVAFIALAILVVGGTGFGAFLYFSHKGSNVPVGPLVVGQASFINNNSSSLNTGQGIDGSLQIDLSNIHAPVPGKSYYAWLLGDSIPGQYSACGSATRSTFYYLGPLSVTNGKVHLIWTGPKGINLLGSTSRLLITEGITNSNPGQSVPAKSTWRYQGEIPQTPDPNDPTNHQSILDRFRCLLYQSDALAENGIQHGDDIQLYLNTHQVFDWASSARYSSDPVALKTLMNHILDYLDGSTLVQQYSKIVPLPDDKAAAKLPLVDLKTGQLPKGLLTRISANLQSLAIASGVTAKIDMLATQAELAIGNVNAWFLQMRKDAEQLIKLSNSQLLLPSSKNTLDDLYMQANSAFFGSISSTGTETRNGVVQINSFIQSMATFDVTPITS